MTASNQKSKQTINSKDNSKNKKFELNFYFVFGIFVLTTIVFFYNQLFGTSFFWEDFVEYVYPVQSYAAREFSHGNIPFWNPHIFSGMPFLADLQVGFFYPINRIVGLFIDSSGNLPVAALQMGIILHFLISQISMYFFARNLKISKEASVFASITYAFSMLMVCHVIHPMMLYHLAWLPLILRFVFVSINETKIESAFAAGLIFGLTMLSGHPQTTLYEGLFIGFISLYLIISKLVDKSSSLTSKVIAIATPLITVALALGIFSIQFLPTRELGTLSQRNEVTIEKASEGSLNFNQVYTAFAPNLFGQTSGNQDVETTYYMKTDNSVQVRFYWETSFYFGIIAMFLSVFYIVSNYNKRSVWLWLGLAVFGFLYALGSNSFLLNIFFDLPYFGTFRNPGRIMFFAIFSFSILAAYGIDSIFQSRENKNFNKNLMISSGIILFFLVLILTGMAQNSLGTPEELSHVVTDNGRNSLIFLILSIVLIFLANRKIVNSLTLGLALSLLTFIDLYSAGVDFNQSPTDPKEFYTMDPQLKNLMVPKSSIDSYRVNMRMYRPSYMAMRRNQGMIDGINLIEGYNPLVLSKVMPPLQSKDELFNLYNVKYEIKIDSLSGQPRFYERNTRFGLAYVVNKYTVIPEDKIGEELKSSKYNLAKEVVLEENPGINLNADSNLNAKVEVIENKANSIKLKVSSNQDGILVFSEIWYPAWKAYNNGVETKIFRANYCFRSIKVSKGDNMIEMKYESSSFATGRTITLICLLICAFEFSIPFVLRKIKNKQIEE